MLNTGIFPQMLKISKVIHRYKKVTKISKIFEKIIYIQMYKYFE